MRYGILKTAIADQPIREIFRAIAKDCPLPAAALQPPARFTA